MPSDAYTIGQYLVDRLHELEVRHLFAVPGPHCANWLHYYVEERSPLQRFSVATAANAGYAADGYARINGVGAVCVPHSVGAFGLLNPIAGAFVERVPVVVINGAPPSTTPSSLAESAGPERPFVGDSSSNLHVYENVTCAAERLTTPEQAPPQIDAALLAALHQSRPVYLEVSGDLFDRPCPPPDGPLPSERPRPSDATSAVKTIQRHLHRADSVVVWGGIGLQRYGLQDQFDALVRTLDVPYVTSLLGKGLLPETHEHFAGILDEPGSPAAVRALAREAEYVLGLGVDASHESPPAFLFETGVATFVRSDETHTLPSPPHSNGSPPSAVGLPSVLPRLRTETTANHFSFPNVETAAQTRRAVQTAQPAAPTPPTAEITYQGFYDVIKEYVERDTIVLSGTGLDRFGSRTLPIHTTPGFVCQAAYRDVGHAPPAAMGVDLASDGERVLVFVGDGGFQMTAQCVGTMAEKGLDPIIFVLNNGVYGSEQRRSDPATYEHGAPFFPQSILQQWHYRKLPDALGGKGWRTETYDQLEAAVEEAFRYTGGPLLIDVRLREKSLPALASHTIDSAEHKIEIAAEALPSSS